VTEVPATPIRVQQFLQKVPLFSELTAEELDRLATATAQVRAPTGTLLFRRGDSCNGCHVIVYGQIKLALAGSDGAEKVVEVLGPGQSFGEAVMFLERPYVVFAEALADSLLLFIGKAALLAEIERNPRLARRMLAGMAMRLHRLMGDLEAYSLKSGTQRVIGYLLRDAPAAAEPGTPFDVELPTSKGVLASRLNITREHFSRILHELTVAGLIKVRGRQVSVLDMTQLRSYTP
jgi:CRP/FNR family transcriptional regulator, dissimilatory nitrate respiration regulator